MKNFFHFLLLLFLPFILTAQIRPSMLVSDNMVLQRNTQVPIWGWSNENEQITIEFNGQSKKVTTDKNGKWIFNLDPMSEGGPFEMILYTEKEVLKIKNIMIGEVWICSGQSNMEWHLEGTENSASEIKDAKNYAIRHFKVPRKVGASPNNKLENGSWELSSPETAGKFTAVGYYFAKELQEKLGVTIGLINASWGGTVLETWMSSEAAQEVPEFQQLVSELKTINLETYIAEKKKLAEDITVKIEQLINSPIPTEENDIQSAKTQWSDSKMNTTDWNEMELPSMWEEQGLEYLDGVVWFRKTISVPKDFIGKEATLSLSKIDDSDITWVNGVMVGETTNSYNIERTYYINPKILKEGENVILVRVEDTGNGGGIWGNSENMKLSSISAGEIALNGTWQYKIDKGFVNIATTLDPNSYPSLLFNGMINPLIPYAIKGTIWYQGESNANRAKQYQTIFPLMIENWRDSWNQDEFPFIFVQLANFLEPQPKPVESDWAELREAQTMTLKLENTGQAVTIDIGDAFDIHPRNKKDVGKRLALNARKIAYNESLIYSGPVYKSMKIEKNKIRIQFNHVGGGLVAKDKYGYLKGFAIAGPNKQFVWAKAQIDGNEIVVQNPNIQNPVAVRYAWADNPDDANLYNKEGLPASPFRADKQAKTVVEKQLPKDQIKD